MHICVVGQFFSQEYCVYQVARESALQFNPDAKIVAYHDSVMSQEYGLDFFKKFDIVMNALDNRG